MKVKTQIKAGGKTVKKPKTVMSPVDAPKEDSIDESYFGRATIS